MKQLLIVNDLVMTCPTLFKLVGYITEILHFAPKVKILKTTLKTIGRCVMFLGQKVLFNAHAS